MVANGLLTNPTLFTGTDITTHQCIQQWVDICFNSTLNLKEYSKLLNDKTLLRTIYEKPPNLTFQCFHHHLVFMLEKILPRKKRQIFNNLQKFSDVLNMLEHEFSIVPQLLNIKDYFKFQSEIVDYEGLGELYEILKHKYTTDLVREEKESDAYDYCKQDGKFFVKNIKKVDNYDLIDLFIEDS